MSSQVGSLPLPSIKPDDYLLQRPNILSQKELEIWENRTQVALAVLKHMRTQYPKALTDPDIEDIFRKIRENYILEGDADKIRSLFDKNGKQSNEFFDFADRRQLELEKYQLLIQGVYDIKEALQWGRPCQSDSTATHTQIALKARVEIFNIFNKYARDKIALFRKNIDPRNDRVKEKNLAPITIGKDIEGHPFFVIKVIEITPNGEKKQFLTLYLESKNSSGDIQDSPRWHLAGKFHRFFDREPLPTSKLTLKLDEFFREWLEANDGVLLFADGESPVKGSLVQS